MSKGIKHVNETDLTATSAWVNIIDLKQIFPYVSHSRGKHPPVTCHSCSIVSWNIQIFPERNCRGLSENAIPSDQIFYMSKRKWYKNSRNS